MLATISDPTGQAVAVITKHEAPLTSPNGEAADDASDYQLWLTLKAEKEAVQEDAAAYFSIIEEINEKKLWRFDYKNKRQFMLTEGQSLTAISISRNRLAKEVNEIVGHLLEGVVVRESHLRPLHEAELTPNEMELAVEQALKVANEEGKKVTANHFSAAASVVKDLRHTNLVETNMDGEQVIAYKGITNLTAAVFNKVVQLRKAKGEHNRAAIFKAIPYMDKKRKQLILRPEAGEDFIQELVPGKKYRVLFYEVEEESHVI